MAFRITSFLRAVTVYAGLAWFGDTVVRPGLIARKAHLSANKVGKPLLNIGHGFNSASLRRALGASPLWGDVNVDVDPDAEAGDGYTLGSTKIGGIEADDGAYGAVLLLHCLEKVQDPLALMIEAQRVLDPSGTLYAVTSPWWAPHAYFRRQWLLVDLPGGKKRAVRLWEQRKEALPETDPPSPPPSYSGGANV